MSVEMDITDEETLDLASEREPIIELPLKEEEEWEQFAKIDDDESMGENSPLSPLTENIHPEQLRPHATNGYNLNIDELIDPYDAIAVWCDSLENLFDTRTSWTKSQKVAYAVRLVLGKLRDW